MLMKQTITENIFMRIKIMAKNIRIGGAKKFIPKMKINKFRSNRKYVFKPIIKLRKKNRKMVTECLSFYPEGNILNSRGKRARGIISTSFSKTNYNLFLSKEIF